MARAIWTGSITFGLLNVPVKLYSAVSSRALRFRELRDDGSRVRHRRVAEEDGEEVPYERIVKGYEIAPDEYVVLTREELEALDPKRSKAIEIEDFVDLDQIDPIYFNQPYYLGPAPGAERAYALLAKAMAEQHKVAIARFVLRNRESLAAIRASADGVLTLETMRFADEVVQPAQLEGELGDGDAPAPKEREVEMAKALIESLATDFDPTSYRDQHREQLLELIERKAQGEKIVAPAGEEPEPTKAPDLMAALEESLAAVKGEELGGGAKRRSGGKRAAAGKAKGGAKKAGSSSKSSSGSKSSSKPKSSASKSSGKSKGSGSKGGKAKRRSRAKAGS